MPKYMVDCPEKSSVDLVGSEVGVLARDAAKITSLLKPGFKGLNIARKL